MNKRNLIIGVIVLGLAIFFLRPYFISSDEKNIESLIQDIQSSIQYKTQLQPIQILKRFQRVHSYLASDFQAKAIDKDKQRVVSDQEAIKNAALTGARYFPRVEITRLLGTINISGSSAQSSFKLIVDGSDMYGVKFRELFDVKLDLSKAQDKWLIKLLTVERQTPEN